MDIDKITSVDGKLVSSEEVSVKELDGLRNDLIGQRDVMTMQLADINAQIEKINILLK